MQGHVAVITGAASGLGFAIAKKLSGMGVQLALLDIQTASLAVIIHEFETEPAIYNVDIRDETAVKKTVLIIASTFGSIDILINCAGQSP